MKLGYRSIVLSSSWPPWDAVDSDVQRGLRPADDLMKRFEQPTETVVKAPASMNFKLCGRSAGVRVENETWTKDR